MSAKVEPGIKTVLFCEEVRQEKSNKYIILGVFNGLIIVNHLPATVPIALYLEYFPVPLGKFTIGLRISGPGKGSFEMAIEANVHDASRPLVLPTPRFEVTLECEGDLLVEVKFEGGEYQKAGSAGVKLDQTIIRHPFPIVAEPRSEQSQSDAPES